MQLVVLSSCGPFDRFVIERVNAVIPIRQVLRTVWPHRANSSRWTRLRGAPWTTMTQAVVRRYDDWRERRLNDGIAESLFPGWPKLPHLDNCLDVDGHAVNERNTQELLRSLEPDLLITTCAPLLKPALFEIPRCGSLNVHRGLAPWYRGERTLFWPLYLHDYERLGVTLHLLDRGIDTGPMLAQGGPDLEPEDDEASITAKCARLAAELLIETLPAILDGSARGFRHSEKGRLCLGRDRKPRHDAAFFFERHVLGHRPPRRRGWKKVFAAAEHAVV